LGSAKKRPVRQEFDQRFFERYYLDDATAVVLTEEVRRLAKFVMAYLDFMGIEVETVLDAACGVGHWKRALRRINGRIEYKGIDASEFLCHEYGWQQSTIAGFRSRHKFDLVICQDVLQYLDGKEVRASVDNLARLCRGALYVDVPTREDFTEKTLELSNTDRDIHVRSVRWYRRILGKHFTSAGGGVFVPNRDRATLLALERM